MLFIRARIKLNTDPNLTPNPIRTHDRAPNPNQTRSQKKLRPVGVELVTWGKMVLFQPERSAYWAKQALGQKHRQVSI